MVKRAILLSFALHCLAPHLLAQNQLPKDSMAVMILLDNQSNQNKKIDSVYLIFDSFSRDGAGMVKQVFYPIDNRITVSVPKGKYYLDLYCLGKFRDRVCDQVVKAKRKKLTTISVKLAQEAFYLAGQADIPAEKFDLANLSITRDNRFK